MSRGGFDEEHFWNDKLWKCFTEEVQVKADDAAMEETIKVLEDRAEISQRWELFSASSEIFIRIFPLEGNKSHFMIVRHALQTVVDQPRTEILWLWQCRVWTRDEWLLKPCRSPESRLRGMAVSNRQAGLQGMPAIGLEDARRIADNILMIRGSLRKRQKDAKEQGTLGLKQKLKL